jgi:shikimate kinase
LGGGVVITDKSRAAISENCKVFLELALLLKLTYRHLRQSF